MIEKTNDIKKRFVKDFSLPIQLIQDPYFDCFIDLYNDEYGSKLKLELLNEVLSSIKSQDLFFKESEKVANGFMNLISDSKAFQEFNSINVDQNFKIDFETPNKNIYTMENINKDFISIDLIKANFNIFKFFNLHSELNIDKYEDIIDKFSNFEYYKKSKYIRQVIFGNLNPKRQQRIQKYVSSKISEVLHENNFKIVSASPDEVIVENEKDYKKINEVLRANLPSNIDFFRVEHFFIESIGNQPFFAKKIFGENTEKTDFKGIPNFLMPQVYKKFKNLEVSEYDLMFYHEGFLAQFKETLFAPEPNKKQKIHL